MPRKQTAPAARPAPLARSPRRTAAPERITYTVEAPKLCAPRIQIRIPRTHHHRALNVALHTVAAEIEKASMQARTSHHWCVVIEYWSTEQGHVRIEMTDYTDADVVREGTEVLTEIAARLGAVR